MREQMRAGTDDTHLAAQHIPELRNFIDAELPEKSPEWVNALVAAARLVRDLFVARTHCAKFVNSESAVLNSGTHLLMEERAWRLKALRDPNDDRRHWKHHGQDETGNSEPTENRKFVRLIECFRANQSGGVQANLGFLSQPITQLGRPCRGTNQHGFLPANSLKKPAGQKGRQIVM